MLTASKRIPELFPFPMAKRAYCKQYAVVLLPIFAYVKSHQEGRRKKEVLFPLPCCLLCPSLYPTCAYEGEALMMQDHAGAWLHPSGWCVPNTWQPEMLKGSIPKSGLTFKLQARGKWCSTITTWAAVLYSKDVSGQGKKREFRFLNQSIQHT